MGDKIEKLKEYVFGGFWVFVFCLIIITISDIIGILKFIGSGLFIWICNFIPLDQSFFVSDSSNTARYLLSAIAQAQAAIIALVVTLTLIAVQLASQSYSPRVMGLFRNFWKNKPFWLLLLFYVVSIMYDVIVLGTIGNGEKIDNQLMYRISFAIFLTGVALITLVPYTRDVMNKLKPENVIEQLIENINRDEFLESINKKKGYGFTPRDLGDDKIVLVIGILKRSIKEDDSATSRFGIRRLKKFSNEIFLLKNLKGIEKYLVSYFCYHFETIGNRAVLSNDKDSVIEVVDAIESIWDINSGYLFSWDDVPENESERLLKHLQENIKIDWVENAEITKSSEGKSINVKKGKNSLIFKLNEEENKVNLEINSIEDYTYISKEENGKINIYDSEKEPKNAIRDVTRSLENIGVESARKEVYEAIWYVVDALGRIADKIKKEPDLAFHVVTALENVGVESAKKKIAPHDAIKVLGMIGVESVGKGTNNLTCDKTIDALGQIGVEGIKNIFPIISDVANSLEKIGLEAVEKESKRTISEYYESMSYRVYLCLSYIGIGAVENNKDYATSYVVNSLGKLGVVFVEKEMGTFAYEVIDTLREIGIRSIEKELKKSTPCVIDYLGKIGIKTAEKESMKFEVLSIIYSLCGLGTEIILEQKDRYLIEHKQKNICKLIEILDELHKKLPEMVEENINNYGAGIGWESKDIGDESQLKAFQEFKKQLTFLK